MSLKKFKPTSPGQRHKLVSDYSEVTTSRPEKSLTKGTGKSGGRNNSGKMTMRYIGGGHKRKYRVIDFKRNKRTFLFCSNRRGSFFWKKCSINASRISRERKRTFK